MTKNPPESNAVSRATPRRAFQFVNTVHQESRRLRWVGPDENIIVQGFELPGGIYIGTPQFFSFSFAIDPDLPVGVAERAEPLNWLRSPVDYGLLTDNQRAFFLQWLRGDTTHIRHVDPIPYFRLYLAGLEWRWAVDGDPDGAIGGLGCDLAVWDNGNFSYHALALLNWWGQLQGPQQQVIVVDEALAFGFGCIPSDALTLALSNLATLQWPAPVALAVEVALHRRTGTSKIPLADLRVRLRDRLTAMYPGGLSLPEKSDRRIRVRYSPICPELNNSRLLSQGNPVPSVEVPAFLENPDFVGPLELLTSSIVAGPVINPKARARVAAETAQVHKFLAARTPVEAEEMPAVPPIAQYEELELAESHRAALQKLLGRRAWNEADFRKLAEEFRLRPAGLRSTLNRWSQERWGDLLLEGSDPIQLNPYVVNQIDKNI